MFQIIFMRKRIKLKNKKEIPSKIVHPSSEDLLKSHQKVRARLLKKLEKEVVGQTEETSEKEVEETEYKINEEPGESSEGLGIEKEEEKGEEAYPELDDYMKDPDLKKDKDEDEED